MDKLAKITDKKDLNHTRREFSKDSEFDLVCKKGMFPYDSFDSEDKFNEKALPSRRMFYNRLTKSQCKLGDYARAIRVWNEFKCETFKDYHDLYLKTDVLLLADVFEILGILVWNITSLTQHITGAYQDFLGTHV